MAVVAILGIMTTFLRPAIEIGKCIAEPIKRQFNYLCCFNSNISDLKEEARKLEDARSGLQMRVEHDINNAQVIVPQVETWLRKSIDMENNFCRIQNETPNIQSGCLTVKSRFSLSKRAKKTSEYMKKLRNQYNEFSVISQPAPPAAMQPVPLGTTYEFESRREIEEKIMTTLREQNVIVTGICGMGGVGKTTMAKMVMNRVREEGLFDETVMVVVSQQVNMLGIQDDIAKVLGLKLEEEGTSLVARANKLHTRLTGQKRILIVLDDVWESLVLEDLGISFERGCRILITSRDRDVLSAMDAEVCEIEYLGEREAWFLFIEKAGIDCGDDPRLYPIAEKIANECQGLPIALVTVGRALKGKKDERIWEDALGQLRSSNPIDMPLVLDGVYKPLRLSYNLLKSEHAKSLFLLCCLLPEDYDIPLEYLVATTMGLHMFEEIKNLEQARNRTCSLVEMLKSCFLLLDGRDENSVRMHDIVRDVAIFIAGRERRIKCDNCTWISSFVGERIELDIELNFPNLRLLLIDNSPQPELKTINDNFFERTTELNVLSMSSVNLSSLPQTTQLLKKLGTLLLSYCGYLNTISVVGELVNLEILICRNCRSIVELPEEIGGLKRLKLLEFSKCKGLKRIAPGVISSLVALTNGN